MIVFKKIMLLVACSVLSIAAFSQKSYQKGSYYNADGEKFSGLLRHGYYGKSGREGDNWFYFKTNVNDERKLSPKDEVLGFVIGKDSFAVIEDFRLNLVVPRKYNRDFAKVVDTGKIHLYLHKTVLPDGNGGELLYETYFVRKDEELYQMVKRRDHKNTLPKLIQDAPELLEELRSKKFKKVDIVDVVTRYNKKFESQ